VQSLNGDFRIEAPPGSGAVVTAVIPVPAGAAERAA
jgi:hypothetical protein